MRPQTHINHHWYCSYTQIHNPLMYNVQLPHEHTHSCITPPPDVHTQTCKLTHLCRHIHLHTFTDIIHRNSHTLVDMHTHRHHPQIFSYIWTLTGMHTQLHRHAYCHRHAHLHTFIDPHILTLTHILVYTWDFWKCAPSFPENLGIWRKCAWYKCRRINVHFMLVNLGFYFL